MKYEQEENYKRRKIQAFGSSVEGKDIIVKFKDTVRSSGSSNPPN
jgi:hypothetical protein